VYAKEYAEDKVIKIALNLLNAGDSISKVVKATGLTSTVRKWKN
jgi:hypothetical protein